MGRGSEPPAPGPRPPGLHRDGLVAEVATRLTHLPRDAAVVVACSGGPDSTALAFLAAEARPDLDLRLVHVAHGLRSAEVDRAEREVVAQHSRWLGVAVHPVDVEVVADDTGIEAAARGARYAALRSVAAEIGAATVLVGHTADDQAETVLLRAARGTGLDGLAAMTAVAGDLTRPLLALRRVDVRGFVAAEGLPCFDDPANTDLRVRRIVVRDQVLPALERVAPDPVGALGRLAALVHDDAVALDAAAADAVAVGWVGPVAVLPRSALEGAVPALGRRVVRQALDRVVDRPPSAGVVEQIRTAPPGLRMTLAGGLELEATASAVTVGPPASDAEAVPLAVPGRTGWPPAGRVVVARTADEPAGAGADDPQPSLDLPGAWYPPPVRVDAAAAPPGGWPSRLVVWLPSGLGPLTLRGRRPGDRVATAGGTRRLAAVLRDARLPRSVRARWPVVTAGERVLWVPGVTVDSDAAAAGRAAPAVALELRRVPRDGA